MKKCRFQESYGNYEKRPNRNFRLTNTISERVKGVSQWIY